MTSDTTDIITATIPRFREISGIGRSKIYEMLDAGDIKSVHVGARRLILIDSYKTLLVRLQNDQKDGALKRPDSNRTRRSGNHHRGRVPKPKSEEE